MQEALESLRQMPSRSIMRDHVLAFGTIRVPRIVVTIHSKPPYGLEIALCVVMTNLIILLIALALKSGQEYFLKRMQYARVDVPEPLPDILQGVKKTKRSCSLSYDDRKAGAGDISTEITLRPPSTNICRSVSSSDSNMQVKESNVVSSSPACRPKDIKHSLGLAPEDLTVDGSDFIKMAMPVSPPSDANDSPNFCCSPKATSDSDPEYDKRNEENAELTAYSDMIDFVTKRYQNLMKASLAGHKLMKDPKTFLLMEINKPDKQVSLVQKQGCCYFKVTTPLSE